MMGAKEGANMHGYTPPEVGTLCVLDIIGSGLSPASLWASGRLPKRSVLRALSRLKHSGFIFRAGYGVWELTEDGKRRKKEGANIHGVGGPHTPLVGTFYNERTIDTSNNEVRGHGFVAVLDLPRDLRNWERREDLMRSSGMDFVSFPQKRTQRILFDGMKVWLSDETVTFYMGKRSFFARHAYAASWDAMRCLLESMHRLEDYLRIGNCGFRSGGRYRIRFARQHHALVRNALATQYDDERRKLFVYGEDGLWLLVDNSQNLHELEAVHPEHAPDDSAKVQIFFNQLRKTGITPDFILGALAKTTGDMGAMTSMMASYSQNLASHVEAIRTLSAKVAEFSDVVADVVGSLGTDARRQQAPHVGCSLREVRFVRDTPAFMASFGAGPKMVGPFQPPARMWLPRECASRLVLEAKALYI